MKILKPKIKFLLIALCVIIWSCDNSGSVHMPKPLEMITIGMDREDVKHALSKLQYNGVMSETNDVIVNGEKVRVQFRYCRTCFGYKLDGVEMNVSRKSKIDTLFDWQDMADMNLKWHIIESSHDLLPNRTPNYALCLYSDNLEYKPEFKTLSCKKKENDPCW